jgi:2-methylisocitrate lyase-like PEP mutase family enzyme
VGVFTLVTILSFVDRQLLVLLVQPIKRDLHISDTEMSFLLGFAFVIFPGAIVRALAKTAQEFYGSLKEHGSTDPFRPRMFDFNALNELIGTPEMIARGQHYESAPARPGKMGHGT